MILIFKVFLKGKECRVSDRIRILENRYLYELLLKEKEYLDHLVKIHFWRRMTSFLEEHAPFVCPVAECNLQLKSFTSLVLHYGAIPHRKVGALILDSGILYVNNQYLVKQHLNY